VVIINEVLSSKIKNDTAKRENSKKKLDIIRIKIKETPLNPEVVSNLDVFLKTLGQDSEVAVRSSGTAEYLASQSFSGQFDTFLYRKTPDEVHFVMKACWASMFKSHIIDYMNRQTYGDKNGDSEPNVVTAGHMDPPTMGVLVMKMVDSRASGVCFSKNLRGTSNETMIRAVLGQGEGLVVVR